MTNLILVIARNSLALTRNAVASFLTQDIGNVQVLLIDNASTDGTGPWVRTLDDRVLTVHFAAPKSVAACWNYGLRWAFSHGIKHVLVANNDVVLRPDTYRILVADGGPFVTGVGVNTTEQAAEAPEPQNRRPFPDFSCFLIRREVFERVQFDERYLVAFGEDCRMHKQMHDMGISAYCIGVPFLHVASGTLKNAEPEERERICQQADRNRELFRQTYGVAVGSPEYASLFTDETCGNAC